MPKLLKKCKILLYQEPLELEKQTSKTYMQFHTAQERLELTMGERKLVDDKVSAIIKTGANVVISTEAIDDIALGNFADHNIIALRHVSKV
jgi:chaperonin GroEL (HSP60 family)